MTRCPHCLHSAELHTGPAMHGRGADELLSADYECGKCGQATLNDDGSWTRCRCPGWYPGLTAMQMTAETIAARAQHNKLADAPPFALTRPISKRRPVQLKLF